jgi:hypothetical protein
VRTAAFYTVFGAFHEVFVNVGGLQLEVHKTKALKSRGMRNINVLNTKMEQNLGKSLRNVTDHFTLRHVRL